MDRLVKPGFTPQGVLALALADYPWAKNLETMTL
jgi:hypothetical protein